MPKTHPPKRLVHYDLINFAAQQPQGFVAVCEARYQAGIAAAAEAVLRSGCPMVMLTGPSSVGKTTSANRLVAEIRARGRKCDIVSLDDFFIGEGKYPKRADGSDDYECPEALDLPQLRQFLRTLAATGRAESPTFDFFTQLPSGVMRPIDCEGGVAVIEGLHALNPLLVEGLPAGSVFNVYASLREEYCGLDGQRGVQTRELRLARRITRDCQFRGHEPAETLAMWDHVCTAERQYVQAFRPRADIILDTSLSYEPCLWANRMEFIRAHADVSCIARIETLGREFAPFTPLPDEVVPAHSILREFIGHAQG